MKVIKISTDSIKLGQFLKLTGHVMTGGECKLFLEENSVKLNQNSIKTRGKQLFDGDVIEVNDQKFLIKQEKCS